MIQVFWDLTVLASSNCDYDNLDSFIVILEINGDCWDQSLNVSSVI
jgi:hypothetical protein